SYLSVPFATRKLGDRFRILASQNSTTVRVNSIPVVTLAKGQSYETVLIGPKLIDANNPILVAQISHSTNYDYVLGDPSMVFLNPTESFVQRVLYETPSASYFTH